MDHDKLEKNIRRSRTEEMRERTNKTTKPAEEVRKSVHQGFQT